MLAACLAVCGTSVHAGTFGVHVVNEVGDPLPGVAVCVGLQGNFRQFGALFTDTAGNATLDVPNVPLVVTVSKNRFTGTRLFEPARGFALMRQVELREGVPGPRCRAGSSLADTSGIPGMIVKDIDISGSQSARLLKPRVDGSPSHYRISARRDFDGVSWQPWEPAINLSAALSNSRQLFMQMRNRSGIEDAYVESLSDVITIVMPRG